MCCSPSLLVSAIILSFSTTAQARVAHHQVHRTGSDASKDRILGPNGVFGGLLVNRQASGEVDCTPNIELNILKAAASGDTQVFCNHFLAIPPATTETDVTPIITRWSTDANTNLKTSTRRTTTTTTETIMETATVTPAPMIPRAANVQLRYNAANAIFESVLASGIDSAIPSTTPLNSEQKEAQAGLTTACLCMNVAPTSTVTSTFTAPTQQTTMMKFVLRLETTVVTKSFTATTTVTRGTDETAGQTSTIASNSSLSRGSSTGPLSVTVLSADSSASANISTFDPRTTGTILPTVISSGVGAPSLPSNPIRLVATALPFNCPESNGKSVTNVVGNEMFEYNVLCDTAIVTSKEIITVQKSSATDCAVECSFVNDVFQKEVCHATTFTAAPGANVGDCLISGATSTYVNKPGSITVILKAVYTSGENCAAIDFANGPTNATIDSSAAISSIKATSISVMIPGLVTTSAAGGVFHTYVSAGETDSLGVYHYSWYMIDASSSYWGAVYKTAWSCTNKLPPRTIVVQNPFTSVIEGYETTIIDGDETYIIFGTSTRRVTAGNGAATPPPVAASTTGGSAAFTTGFSTATQTATAGDGVQVPSVTPLISGAVSSQTGSNQTLVIGGTASEGSDVFSTAGGVSTFNSTGNGGAITPSPSSTALSASIPVGTVNITAVVTSAVTVVVTSGGAGATMIGSTATSNFTNSGGSLIPSATSGAAELTISGGTSTSNATGGFGTGAPSQTSAAAELTLIGDTSTEFSTGGGYGRSTSAAEESLPNSTGLPATSGGAEFATSGSTFTANAIGGSGQGTGSVVPSPSASQIFNSSIPLPTASIQLVTYGSQVLTEGGATSTSNFTGGAGIGVPSLSLTASESIISGSTQLSMGENTSVFFSTGGGGAVTPIPITSNVTLPSTTSGWFIGTVSDGVSTANSTGGFGTVVPSPTSSLPSASGAVTISSKDTAVASLSTGGVANFSTFGETAMTSATGGSGVISSNGSVTASASLISSLSINVTISVGTGVLTTVSGTSVISATGRTGVVVPSGNSSIPALSSVTPSPRANVTGTASSGAAIFSISIGTAVTSVSQGTGVVFPSVNVTTLLPLSLTPRPSLNATTTGPAFTNSDRDRTGSFSRPRTTDVTLSGTAPIGTAPPQTINFTALLATGVSSVSERPGYPQQPSVILTPSSPSNVTSFLRTSPPSITVPPISANATSAPSTNTTGSISDDDRAGSFSRLRSTGGSGEIPMPTANITLWSGTSASVTASEFIPTTSANANVSAAFPTPSTNSTELPLGTGSSSIPATSVNSTAGGNTASSAFATATSNMTFGTGYLTSSSLIPLSTANTNLPVGTGSSSIFSPSVNSSVFVGTRSSAIPTTSTYITVPLSTGGTASLAISTVSANSSAAVGTGSSAYPTIPLSTGGTASTIPTLSANVTIPLSTGFTALSSSVLTPSANSSFPIGSGSSALPTPSGNSTSAFSTGTADSTGVLTLSANATFSNTEVDRNGRYSTGTAFSASVPTLSTNSTAIYSTRGTAMSSGFPTPSSNASFSYSEGNRTGVFSTETVASTDIAPIAANSTGFLPTASGLTASSATPTLSLNSTGLFPTGTGSSSPSLTPTASLNSSKTCSFTTPVVHIVLETTVITRLITETPTACPTGGNATLPIGTAPLQPTYLTSTINSLPPSASAALVSRRLANVTASPEQIAAACASKDNVLFNPDLELQDDNNAFGWSNVPQDQFISFRTFPSTSQHTKNGTRSGRVLSAAAGRSIDISQPVTLCLGKQYELSAWNRQQSLLSQCSLEYWVGDDRVFIASPQMSWLKRSQFFTVPDSVERASVNIRISVACKGSAGAPVGTDEAGFMVAEFDDVSLMQN